MDMRLGSPSFAKFAKATATTVYLMTAVKATVRPAFNLADKKSDKQARKYSAVNEFLYQVVCLGFAVAMIPLFEKGGFKLAQKYLKKIPGLEKVSKLNKIPGFEKINKLGDLKKAYLEKSFDKEHVEKISAIKAKVDKKLKLTEAEETLSRNDKALHKVYGGVEAGSFIASILGLTILAPKIGHEILHPIMHAMGMNKKENNVGQPTELFLADAKVPTEKADKINVNA